MNDSYLVEQMKTQDFSEEEPRKYITLFSVVFFFIMKYMYVEKWIKQIFVMWTNNYVVNTV